MLTGPGWLDQALATFGYLAVFVAVGLESMGVPFPGETALVAAAVYAGTGGSLNIVGVIVAAAAGAIVGDNAGYAIGRYGGYALLRRYRHILPFKWSTLEAAQRYFARHGNKTVFLGRFVAILRTWVAFLAGLNRMPWRSFLVWNALGGIVWATLYGLLGYTLGRNLPLLDRVRQIIGWGGVALALVVAVVAAGVIWWRRRAALRNAGDAAELPPEALDPPVRAHEGGPGAPKQDGTGA
jgi:membrane protein DedA with SNARE-associated domain